MEAEKFSLNNRNGLKIVILVHQNQHKKGLAFVAHGLGGFKEQLHIQTFIKAFFREGYTVVVWDATNSIGESDGKVEDATLTNYYQDFQDVVNWTKKQTWYQEPFIVCGHSLGAISAALYAEENPEKVKGLAPISTVVSGRLTNETMDPGVLKEWKEKGYIVEESKSKPGVFKRLNWAHIKDRLKYDLIPRADVLTMPVLLIVGEKDIITPLDHQEILFNALPAKQKELHLIKGAEHTFRTPEELLEVEEIFRKWLRTIN